MPTDPGSSALLLTALVVGVTHTLMGPDHYLPFIALSKARSWSITRTLSITLLCGIGHVMGSILIGFLGLGLGWGLGGLESIESVRGEIAAWLLTALGGIYMVWGIKQIGRNKPHTHIHAHADGTLHSHTHTHHKEHAHPHANPGKRSVTAWSLFIIFVFGPCEAFIPILLFPAVQHDWQLALSTTLIFMVATIGTMMGIVYMTVKGLTFISLSHFERYGHAAAGFAILMCGAAIHLGL